MRRSFGGSGGMGGGGGGGAGGGGMLRTVQRAVRTGRVGGGAPAQEPFSHSSTATATATANGNNTPNPTRHTYKPNASNILSLSSSSTASSSSSSSNYPISSSASAAVAAAFGGPTWQYCSSPVGGDEFDWECVDGVEEEGGIRFCDDLVFGSVPSQDEVQHAVSSLQQFLDTAPFSQLVKDRIVYSSDGDVTDQDTNPSDVVHSVGSEVDWMEPSLQLCNPLMLQPYGSERVLDAFHLLQYEPSVQKMVISLSSDKAVWNAVMNNEVVRELRNSLDAADNSTPESSDKSSDDPNAAANIFRWMFVNTKAKVAEVIEKITKLVNELFQAPDGEKATEGAASGPFEEKLRTSFLLSVVVLLIVVVTRAHGA